MEPITLTLFEITIAIRNERDVNGLSRMVNAQASAIKMGVLDKTKLITAASELARNILNYAGLGRAVVTTISRVSENGIRIAFIDEGPGIPNVLQVMQDGYSTVDTLGLGLPGAQRLTDEFSIISEVNKGTTVIITKWANG